MKDDRLPTIQDSSNTYLAQLAFLCILFDRISFFVGSNFKLFSEEKIRDDEAEILMQPTETRQHLRTV